MEPQKRDKIQAIAATVAVHLVVLLVLWFTLLGPEPMGSGSGVLVQVGLVDEASGMFESNATEPQQPQAEQPRENDDELITQTDEESIQIEKKKEEDKKKKAVQENKKDDRIANQVKNAFGKGVSNDGSRGDSDKGSGTQGNPFGNASTGELTGVGGYGGYNADNCQNPEYAGLFLLLLLFSVEELIQFGGIHNLFHTVHHVFVHQIKLIHAAHQPFRLSNHDTSAI